MATIKNCEKCGRKNGFAVDENAKVCARCAGKKVEKTISKTVKVKLTKRKTK